jgi:CBS domain-containing protein
MDLAFLRSQEDFVSHTMATSLLTIGPGETLTDAAGRMAARRVGAILVTEDERLAGILTERDVLRAVGKGDISGTVADWMTREPVTVGSNATNGQAAMMMIHGGFRHVPIVDDDKLVGIVSIRDLLALPNESPSGV